MKLKLVITVTTDEPLYPLQYGVDAVEDVLSKLRSVDPEKEKKGDLPPSVRFKTEDGYVALATLTLLDVESVLLHEEKPRQPD